MPRPIPITVEPDEFLEETGYLIRRYADTLVDHCNLPVLRDLTDLHGHFCAFGIELDRVADQVRERAAQQEHIGLNQHVRLR